jgi:hypothetical protein
MRAGMLLTSPRGWKTGRAFIEQCKLKVAQKFLRRAWFLRTAWILRATRFHPPMDAKKRKPGK